MHASATMMDVGLYCAVVSVATGAPDETENLFVIQHFSNMSPQEQRQAVLLLCVWRACGVCVGGGRRATVRRTWALMY